MDQTKQEEDYGYDLFPERNTAKYKKGSIGESLFTFNHKCQVMLQFAMETSESSFFLASYHLKRISDVNTWYRIRIRLISHVSVI